MFRRRSLLHIATVGAGLVLATACQTTPVDSPVTASPSVTAPEAKTEVVNVVAVVDGQPADGYADTTPAGEVNDVSMCDASPSGVSAGIYRCSPSAAAADACWKSTGATLLCVNDPWKKELHRVTVTDQLPSDPPVAAPIPFALLLDNGVQCRIRSGGAWGGRDDGLVGAYGCTGDDVVLVPMKGGTEPVDRSQPLWTVKTGPLGVGDAHFPPPQTHAVTTAWFAKTVDSGA